MKRALILFSLLFSAVLNSQNTDWSKELEELRVVLSRPGDDTAKVSAYIALTEYYFYQNPDTVIPIANLGLDMLARLSEKAHAGLHNELLQRKAALYNNIGFVYDQRGDANEALRYYLKALKIAEDLKDKKTESYLLANIGYLYGGIGNPEAAEKAYMRGILLAKELQDYTNLGYLLNNLATLYSDRKDFERAHAIHLECLEARKTSGDLMGMAVTLNNLGYAEQTKQNHKLAKSYYLRSLALLDSLKHRGSMVQAAINVANIYSVEKNRDSSVHYSELAHSTAQAAGFPDPLSKSAYHLAFLYEQIGRHKEANPLYRLHIKMRDSLSNDEMKKTAFKQQARYEFEKKEVLMKAEQQKKEEEIKRQRLLITFTVGGLLLVLVFSFFLFKSLRENQAKNRIISEQKSLVEVKQKEILDSINYAKQIQRTLLANHEMVNQTVPDSFVMFRPKDIVSGDFYWAASATAQPLESSVSAADTQQRPASGLFFLAVCDSTGHGVPGAFMSLLNISFLNEAIKEKQIAEPGEVFNFVRQRLVDNISKDGQRDGFDGILLCFGAKSSTGEVEIRYAAANNAPLLITNGQLLDLPCDKMPVGKGEKINSFSTHSIKAKKGDMLYLFTDGYADQFGGPKGKKFKYKQLEELLLLIHNRPVQEQSARLQQTFESWSAGFEQVDDVCVMGIRI